VLSLPLDYPGGNALNRAPPARIAHAAQRRQNFCYAVRRRPVHTTSSGRLVLLSCSIRRNGSFAHVGECSMPTRRQPERFL